MKGSLGLGEILNATLSDLGLFPKALKYQVFSLWAKIVGDVAKYAKPRRLQGDVLFVATASSVWSQELYYMRDSILAKVNQALGGEFIKELRFSEHMWGAADGGAPSAERHQLPRSAGDNEAVPQEAQGIDIADPGLSRAFKRVARTMTRRKQYLLSRGYSVCRTCGSVYPKEKGECPSCRLQREFVALTRAIAILDKSPATCNEELAALLDLPDARIGDRARVEVESRLLSSIRYRLAVETRDAAANPGSSRKRSPERDLSRAEVAAAIRKLASLRSGAAYETMSPEDIERAVGRRYASLARKG